MKTYEGKPLSYWSKKYGVSISIIHRNWSAGIRDKKLFELKNKGRGRKGMGKKVNYHGVMMSVKDLQDRDGLTKTAAYNLITKHIGSQINADYTDFGVATDKQAWHGLTAAQRETMKEFEATG